jgi:hypothetical protein
MLLALIIGYILSILLRHWPHTHASILTLHAILQHWLYIYICIYIMYIYTYIFIYVYTHMCISYMLTYLHISIHILARTYSYMYIYTVCYIDIFSSNTVIFSMYSKICVCINLDYLSYFDHSCSLIRFWYRFLGYSLVLI